MQFQNSNFVVALLLQFLFCACSPQKFSLEDLFSSISDISRGLDPINGLLSPEYTGQISTNLLKGLPSVLGVTVLDQLCSSVSASGAINPAPKYQPLLKNIKLQLRTGCERVSYSLAQLSDVAQNPLFDPQKKIVIFASGWNTTINNYRHDIMSKAYSCRADTNYFALDNGDYINTLYSWSALNTDAIGRFLAEHLIVLSQIVPLENIHLLGHSLGAQIMGSAARYFRNMTGKQIVHMTGLDPALPCFSEGEMLTTLTADDADFVDIIHTALGVFGQSSPTGNVDFYIDGKFPIVSGCKNTVCSHERVLEFYAESVYPGNEYNFLAKRCTTLGRFQTGRCKGEEFPMGYAVPFNLKGRFVLQVNVATPYGKNSTKKYIPFNSSCGSCNLSGPV